MKIEIYANFINFWQKMFKKMNCSGYLVKYSKSASVPCKKQKYSVFFNFFKIYPIIGNMSLAVDHLIILALMFSPKLFLLSNNFDRE
ncbi:hypothetical protein BpHYR1_016266 [Brachionus plicatilis]|uniref:Uncharacterized protein n=1 Tax=Brachionus plicatilis TaxID=10195 RepID=A0A3M7RKE7_BRAPC|nr:hypothetical protein BpHYR1_016266 [Brachionus plicatilis]